MYNQLYEYFDNILCQGQCGFRKEYSAQHCLLVMIKKFKEAIDRGNEFGALVTVIYFLALKPRLMYLLVMLQLKLTQKKLYLES